MKNQKSTWMAMLALVLAFVWIGSAQATALTEARDTAERAGQMLGIGVATGTTIYAGSLVAINAAGFAVPAADATGLKAVGRAETTVVNGGGNGAVTVVVKRGVFCWANGDSFTIADVGTVAYVADDATVQKAGTATYDIIAGVIVAVDGHGVWVDTYVLPSAGSASIVNLVASGTAAVTGNATIGGTLGVTGNATLGGTAAVAGTLGVTGATTLSTATASGLIKGGTIGIGSGVLARVEGALVWIEGGVTNAIDADVTQ